MLMPSLNLKRMKLMGILDSELEKFEKSEKFKKLVNREIKSGKISGGSNLKKLNIEAAEKNSVFYKFERMKMVNLAL